MTDVQEIASARAVQWVSKDSLTGAVRRKVNPAAVVLDIGCGIKPQTLVWPRLHLCVEIHDEYVDYLRERFAGSPSHVLLRASWQDAMRVLPDRSVDTVFALDFIEHLSRDEGFRFLDEACRIASRQVVIFTPFGYFPQSYDRPDAEDRWGMHGGFWQTHRSGWIASDFPPEWEIIACRDYHTSDQNGLLQDPVACMWAIRSFDKPWTVTAADKAWLRRLRLQTMVHRYLPPRCLAMVPFARRLANWRKARTA